MKVSISKLVPLIDLVHNPNIEGDIRGDIEGDIRGDIEGDIRG